MEVLALGGDQEETMPKPVLASLKMAALFAVLILALIAVLFVFDIIGGELAEEFLVKALALLGILTLASLVIVFIAKGGKEPEAKGGKKPEEP
jgi:uncharacterized RDD family membrane protein YckC